jgi:penicillin amidase
LIKAFKLAVKELKLLNSKGQLEWSKYKSTGINHLTKLAPFSRLNLSIGGGTHIINAATNDHGPSWRMVVSLTKQTEAFGIYPGGQSGNPGSRFYDNFVNDWAAGKYYSLWMMTKEETKDRRVKWKMNFGPKSNMN